MILYFVDDELDIIYHNKTITYPFKEIINKGRIVDREKFILKFNQILKKEKIRNKLFGNYITILKEEFYHEADLFFFESIFEDLGFVHIKYIDIRELLDQDYSYIEINNTYLVFHLEEVIWIDLHVFNDIPFLLHYFKPRLKNEIVLFGKNKNIPSINIPNFSIYYIDQYKTFITDQLVRMCNQPKKF